MRPPIFKSGGGRRAHARDRAAPRRRGSGGARAAPSGRAQRARGSQATAVRLRVEVEIRLPPRVADVVGVSGRGVASRGRGRDGAALLQDVRLPLALSLVRSNVPRGPRRRARRSRDAQERAAAVARRPRLGRGGPGRLRRRAGRRRVPDALRVRVQKQLQTTVDALGVSGKRERRTRGRDAPPLRAAYHRERPHAATPDGAGVLPPLRRADRVDGTDARGRRQRARAGNVVVFILGAPRGAVLHDLVDIISATFESRAQVWKRARDFVEAKASSLERPRMAAADAEGVAARRYIKLQAISRAGGTRPLGFEGQGGGDAAAATWVFRRGGRPRL